MSASPSDSPQIATWVRADAERSFCARPWRQVAVLSDGTAVCACVDAGKTNPLGNVFERGFDAVWSGPAYRGLRRQIAKDIDKVPICQGCPMRITARPDAAVVEAIPPKPQVLFIESYAGCNLACPGCDRNAIEGTRSELMMDFDKYCGLIDSLSPDLKYMEFHLGGENWMHKRGAEMVRYCKERNPKCAILTSTNGHFFHNDERALDALNSGLDVIIFSIDGVDQESYEKYRVNGRFQRAMDGMERMVRLKRSSGLTQPMLIWRYILFPWSGAPEQMQRARELAQQLGVELCWHLNGVAGDFSHERYYVGSPHLHEIQHELWDTLPGRVGWDLDLGYDSYPVHRY
jgi:pyruvate-formate lyase-activating enzyme